MNKTTNSETGTSSVSINIGSILSNALLQPLTQGNLRSNLTFSSQTPTRQEPTPQGDRRDPREQYYYEEEYDDEEDIDLESRRQADPPIRKVRAGQGEKDLEDDDDYNNRWVIPSKANEVERMRANRGEGVLEATGGEGFEDSPEVTREEFSEAILHEWRERTEEVDKQNEEMDKDEYTRYEHPSIVNFAKAAAAERSLASTDISFAVETRTQYSSLNTIKKRFAADDEEDSEFGPNASPRASKELLE